MPIFVGLHCFHALATRSDIYAYAVISFSFIPYNAVTILLSDGLASQNHDERKLSLFQYTIPSEVVVVFDPSSNSA